MSALAQQRDYQQALADLQELQQEDTCVSGQRVPEDAKAQQLYYAQYWLALYVRYVRLAKQLVRLHDTELQPQRRHDMRTVLDSCLGRMLEARHNIVQHSGDFASLDDTLEDMKLPAASLDPPLPTYILEDRQAALTRDRAYVLSLQQHYGDTETDTAPVAVAALTHPAAFRKDPTKALPPLPSKAVAAVAAAAGTDGHNVETALQNTASSLQPRPSLDGPPTMSLQEAVRILQLAERGRQARQRAKIQLQLYRQQQYAAAYGAELRSLTGKDRAASIVQKVALGYLQQKRDRVRYQQEQELLGMAATPAIRSETEKIAAEMRREERKARQRVNQAALTTKEETLAQQLKTQEGPKTLERMLDEVLMHIAYAQLDGKAKDGVMEVPSNAEGGTLALLGRLNAGGGSDNATHLGATALNRKGTLGGGATGAGAGAALSTSGPRKSSVATVGGGPAKAGDAGEATAAPLVPPSSFLGQVPSAVERYNTTWKDKFKESYVDGKQLDQPYDLPLLRQELLDGPRGVMHSLRQCVDQLVLMEVSNLRDRVEAEKNAGKRAKGRKGKKEKKPKKPKLKDPTKGEDLESYLNTTIYENKLQLPPVEVRLASYLGATGVAAGPWDRALRTAAADEELRKKWSRVLRGWSAEAEKAVGMPKKKLEELFMAYEAQASWLQDPSPAEVRTAAAEYGVLPLGSQVIHDLAPHPPGLFLYGASGAGKTLLAYAIANEAGARFFNLSAGNFLTTKGMAKMVQVVFYTARMMGPSVIYFDNLEKIFPGKGGKSKKGDAEAARGAKLKKELLRGFASVEPTDRVLLIATSTQPWTVDVNTLAKYFPRALHLAPPDYASRELLLRQCVEEALQAAQLPSLSHMAVPIAAAISEALRQVSTISEGLSAGQLRRCVAQALPPHRLERLMRHALAAEEFLPALATATPLTPADVQRFHDFQASLPVTMRRANAEKDFPATEDDGKRAKPAAASRKK